MSNVKLMQGNEACIQGALVAGLRFFGGYPITPSTEIAEMAATYLPKYGGKFIQMEDEIASIASIIGASLTGVKSMTATSGPGFSLMQENLGYACITEVPCVIVNVQRGGPSTGLPTSPSQGDVMQARWGTHGDHQVIAIAPNSVPEIFFKTIRAFNLSEKYRVPVILMLDEVIAHMREKIELPIIEDIEIVNRKKTDANIQNFLPYENTDDLIPSMANFGEGYRYHVTGLVHDETGFPSNDPINADRLINRLHNKIVNNKEDIIEYENYKIDDAEVMIIAYGSVSRSAKEAIDILRKEGVKAGLFRPITLWPFPEEEILRLTKNIKNIIVCEMNLGQIFLEVSRIIKNSKISFVGKIDGTIIKPDEIIQKVREVITNE